MAEENLRSGGLCQADEPGRVGCWTPQLFMVNSMHIHSLVRYLNNYGDPTGLLASGITRKTTSSG